jgi:ABC-type transporter MlaC component
MILFAIGIGFASGAPVQAAGCPEEAIAQRAGSDMIAAAKAGSAQGFASALQTHADMTAITVFALGKHRKSLPNARLGELVTATTSFVSRTFEGYRLKFRAESQKITACRGDKVVGKLYFLGGKPEQSITWRFKNRRVVDVNIQGVWLSQLLRKNFDTTINEANGDINALFAALKK